MVTPLQPEEFFAGLRLGKEEFRLRSILRWRVPDQHEAYQGRTTLLPDTL